MFEPDWELSDFEFEFFRKLIFDLAGISLSLDKKQLVHTRIRSYAQKNGFSSFRDYIKHLKKDEIENSEIQNFINSLTTNKTDFFRESEHFNVLRDFISDWKKKNKESFNLWCAASSTGEEPYSLSIVLNELFKDQDYKILATDIDTKVLSIAQNGVYEVSKLKDIPLHYHSSAILKGRDDVRGWFKIKDEIRNRIIFKKLNLIDFDGQIDEKFDVVFLRNVLIYFNRDSIETVVNNLYKHVKPNGLLIIGFSETLSGLATNWKFISPSVYQK